MTRARLAAAALAMASCCATADPESPDVAVFTLSTMPVRADGARVYELDLYDRLAGRFGAGLPSDPDRALALARRRLESTEGRERRAALAEAAAANALAARLGIEKLPAVVVDGRYVVYGVRDGRRALDRVAAWRRENESLVLSGPGNARSLPHPPRGTSPARSPSSREDRR